MMIRFLALALFTLSLLTTLSARALPPSFHWSSYVGHTMSPVFNS